jgi:hypothetical protein
LGDKLPREVENVAIVKSETQMCKKIRVMLGHKSHRKRDIVRRNFRILVVPCAAESSSMAKTWINLLDLMRLLSTSV